MSFIPRGLRGNSSLANNLNVLPKPKEADLSRFLIPHPDSFIVGLNWRKFRVDISLETEKEDFDLSTSGATIIGPLRKSHTEIL